ncbi:DUF1127 domain-containing protein [Roseococcus pinisoli]|uniref:DUF1127 domain-containing protein n=1 Tax=Roseococcus pinisoli TaxID=2835040 RepID=A0ABS5QHB2_9PROT|nr:DUF1127 domain-containing protein [Roseococcus pinisoli]MBS7812878.1 DUF1127 domain-containing protein [Roseococcus pinisoli]
MSAAQFLSPTASRLSAGSEGRKVGILWLEQLSRFWRAYETRQHLAALDEHMLRDIGVTATQARYETMRRPWDITGC